MLWHFAHAVQAWLSCKSIAPKPFSTMLSQHAETHSTNQAIPISWDIFQCKALPTSGDQLYKSKSLTSRDTFQCEDNCGIVHSPTNISIQVQVSRHPDPIYMGICVFNLLQQRTSQYGTLSKWQTKLQCYEGQQNHWRAKDPRSSTKRSMELQFLKSFKSICKLQAIMSAQSLVSPYNQNMILGNSYEHRFF